MSSITVHNIDPEIDKRLRELSEQRHSSLNQTIQWLLKQALGISRVPGKKSDFAEFAGTWAEEDAREFEEATKEFSEIDQDMWK